MFIPILQLKANLTPQYFVINKVCTDNGGIKIIKQWSVRLHGVPFAKTRGFSPRTCGKTWYNYYTTKQYHTKIITATYVGVNYDQI